MKSGSLWVVGSLIHFADGKVLEYRKSQGYPRLKVDDFDGSWSKMSEDNGDK